MEFADSDYLGSWIRIRIGVTVKAGSEWSRGGSQLRRGGSKWSRFASLDEVPDLHQSEKMALDLHPDPH
jgi:hypothetical protein